MAVRRTTKLINELAGGSSVKNILADGRICIYSGAQPTDADAAPSGTKLLTFTEGGNTFTAGTGSYATIAIGGSATGAITTVTVGSMAHNLLSESVSYVTSASVTAIAIADNINARNNPLNITAEASTTNVILTLPIWIGAEGDGLTFATTTSGSLTATTSGAFGSGAAATNGINFRAIISDGTLTKDSNTWQGTGIATGTAGWFRFIAGDSTESDTGVAEVRFDGSVGTSNADMIISATSIVVDSVYTISAGTIIEPKE